MIVSTGLPFSSWLLCSQCFDRHNLWPFSGTSCWTQESKFRKTNLNNVSYIARNIMHTTTMTRMIEQYKLSILISKFPKHMLITSCSYFIRNGGGWGIKRPLFFFFLIQFSMFNESFLKKKRLLFVRCSKYWNLRVCLHLGQLA